MALQHFVPKTIVTKDLHHIVQLLNITVTGTTWKVHTGLCPLCEAHKIHTDCVVLRKNVVTGQHDPDSENE